MLAPDPSSYKRILCKRCGSGFAKTGTFLHVTSKCKCAIDVLEPGAVKAWKSVKDAWAIGNKKAESECKSFEMAHATAEQQRAAAQVQPTLASAIQAQTAAIIQVIGNAKPVVPKVIIRHTAQSSGATTHQPQARKVPKIKLQKKALAFKKLSKADREKTDDRRLNEWPVDSESKLDLGEVMDYIKDHSDCNATAGQSCQGVQYFFALLKLKEPQATALDTFIAIIKQGVVPKMMRLAVLDPSIPWTRKIVSGMDLMVDWACGKAVEIGDTTTAPALAQYFRVRFVKPLRKKFKKETIFAKKRRENIDKRRRSKLPPQLERGIACNWALIDLKILLRNALAVGHLLPATRRAASACLVLLLAYRTHPVRPGELELFPLDRAVAFTEDPDAWYLTVSEWHKTFGSEGDIGRMIPPEVKEVMIDWVKLQEPLAKFLSS